MPNVLRLAFLCVAITATTAYCQEPTLKLPAEVAGEPGDYIEIHAETDGVVEWVALPDANYRTVKIFPINLLKDTRTAVVSQIAPGEYKVLAYTARGDVPSKPQFTIVKIGKAPPGPTPPGPAPPVPVPPGPSPIPDGVHGLTRWAYDLCMTIPVASRANASGVATNLESVAAAAAAGTIANQQQMFDDLKSRNSVTLANDRPAWTPFAETFRAKLNSLISTGKLNTVLDVAEAFRATADGMKLASAAQAKGVAK